MKQERSRDGLDYALCRYPGSDLRFRGPARTLAGPYVAVIGGSEVFGRFVPSPFTTLLEQSLGLEVVNLGIQAAGIDVFLRDRAVRSILSGAKAVVIQVMGAQNLSNRYYTVHPRRNDRFVQAAPTLQALYPEVDFSQFAFTRHMLASLREAAPASFVRVRGELQAAWLARMSLLVRSCDCPAMLLDIRTGLMGALGSEPPLIAPDMVEALERLAPVCRVDVRAAMGEHRTAGMSFDRLEWDSARRQLTTEAHRRVHARVGPMVERLLRAEQVSGVVM